LFVPICWLNILWHAGEGDLVEENHYKNHVDGLGMVGGWNARRNFFHGPRSVKYSFKIPGLTSVQGQISSHIYTTKNNIGKMTVKVKNKKTTILICT